MNTEPLFKSTIAGYTVELYENRIVERRTSLFGKQESLIFLKNITNIDYGVGKRFTVKTNDGKTHVFNVAGNHAKTLAQLLQERI